MGRKKKEKQKDAYTRPEGKRRAMKRRNNCLEKLITKVRMTGEENIRLKKS